MNIFFAKIGKSNSEFDKYLDPLKLRPELNGRPCAPIFFDSKAKTREDLLNRKITNHNSNKKEACTGKQRDNSAPDINNFFWCGKEPFNYGKPRILVLNNYRHKLYIYKPIGSVFVENMKHNGVDNFAVKLLPVEEITNIPYENLPPIILGLGCNQNLARGTFKQIHPHLYPGVVFAIKKLLNPNTQRPWNLDDLDLLDFTQFETLLARIFEEHGFFVPAMKGGNIPGIDLLPKNISNKKITIFNKTILPGKSIAIQAKLRSEKISMNAPSNLLHICVKKKPTDGPWIDGQIIKSTIQTCEKTEKWLRLSISEFFG